MAEPAELQGTEQTANAKLLVASRPRAYTAHFNTLVQQGNRHRRALLVAVLAICVVTFSTLCTDLVAIEMMRDMSVDTDGAVMVPGTENLVTTAQYTEQLQLDDFWFAMPEEREEIAEGLQHVTLNLNETTIKLRVEGYRTFPATGAMTIYLARNNELRFLQSGVEFLLDGQTHTLAKASMGLHPGSRKLLGVPLLVASGGLITTARYVKSKIFTCERAQSGMACDQFTKCKAQYSNFAYHLYQGANQARFELKKVLKRGDIECSDAGGSWFGSANFASCGGTGFVNDTYWHSFNSGLIARNVMGGTGKNKRDKTQAAQIALDFMNAREACHGGSAGAYLHALMDENNNRVGVETFKDLTEKKWWWVRAVPPSPKKLSDALLAKLCDAKKVYYSGPAGTANWNQATVNARTASYDGKLWIAKGGRPTWC